MLDNLDWTSALEKLSNVQVKLKAGGFDVPLEPSITAKAEVLAQFQPIFAPAHLPELTEVEFRSFLPFRSNRHWSGLLRLGPRMCADMDRLRAALMVLLDEQRPIEDRYDQALASVSGLGRAVATAILLVVYPDRYGVWNNTSEGGLKAVNLWPQFARGENEGKRYVAINAILNRLCRELAIDLWTLDAFWYYVLTDAGAAPPLEVDHEEVRPAESALEIVTAGQAFGLERHLHEFLRDNWDKTELGHDWALYQEPGNEWAGYEYPCDVGRIDLLAHHRREPKWLVVELKRSQTGDQTLGQIMRYMGWVKHHLAEPNEEIRGLIVAHDTDASLRYAVSMAPTVDLHLYEVRFNLKPAPEPTPGRRR